MINKKDFVEVLNAMNKGTPLPFNERILPLVSEYLTEIKYENPEKVINLIVQNNFVPTDIVSDLIQYYKKKLNICSISYNNKILCYYE